MDAATIIRDFTAKGVQLAATKRGTISITPSSRLTDVDRDLLRKHKADVLAELQSVNIVNIVNIDSGHLPRARIVHETEPKFTDDYARLEREAIVWESELPPFDDPTGCAGVPGFAGMPNLTAAQHGVIRQRLMNPAQEPPPTARAPERVTCSSCVEFIPGHEPNSLGKCALTADGLPPVASRGYGCCFPFAPRICPDYKEI